MKKKKQKGQSLLEFALLLPIMTGMVMLLIQIEMAINTAIVSQKYTRTMLLHLFFNSRYYPELQFVEGENDTINARFWEGMDSRVSPTPVVFPVPPKVRVGVVKVKNDEDPEAKARQNVHIKITSFTCVPPYGVKFSAPFTEGNLEEDSFLGGKDIYCGR